MNNEAMKRKNYWIIEQIEKGKNEPKTGACELT